MDDTATPNLTDDIDTLMLSNHSNESQPALLRLGALFQDLPIACICFDTHGQVMEWNRICEELFRRIGQKTVFVLQQPIWRVLGREEDDELTKALVTSVLKGCVFSDLEWEDIGPDGERRHLLTNAYPIYGPEKVITGGVFATIDITLRKATEHALWESDQRWQLALRGNNDGIWDWDLLANKIFLSERWKELLGYSDEELENHPNVWFQQIHPDDLDCVKQALQQHKDRVTTHYTSEHRMRCKDGSYKWVLDRAQALWNRSNEVLRIAGSLTDITERKLNEQRLIEANRRLENLATRDGLTGIRNHRAFQDGLKVAFERFQRYGEIVSIVLLDVDHFKQYNDTYGHPAGDVILKRVAKILEENVREVDIAARYGGEEFILLLPYTGSEGARVVAERCRIALESEPWPARLITASVGYATLTTDMSGPDVLIEETDQALYISKASGRNRVTGARCSVLDWSIAA